MAAATDLGQLKLGDFSPHLNTDFEMKSPGGAVPLKLTSAVASGAPLPKGLKSLTGEELKPRDGGGFTLQFVAPQGPWLPQAIYPVTHPKLGTLELFLVPNGPVHGGHGYHAVFG
jgi:hypothetical protein